MATGGLAAETSEVVLPSGGAGSETIFKPVLLASVADKARLEQLLYSALEAKLLVRTYT